MLKNSKLYLILDTDVNDYQRLYAIAKIATRYGVDIVQLRDKLGCAKNILKCARRIRRLFKDRIPLLVNDRVDLALACGASGVHLGQDDIPVDIARKMMGSKAIIGKSCQTLKHAKEAQDQGADYIGFGSVFKTKTKPKREPMNMSVLREVSSSIRIPVFAIGGINLNNVSAVRLNGITRIAVCRAICQAPNIKNAVMRIKNRLEL